MIIVMAPRATEEERDTIIKTIREQGLDVNVSVGTERTVIGVIGPEEKIRRIPLEAFGGVENVMRVTKPYKRVSREFHPEPTVVTIGADRSDATPVKLGGGAFCVIAGPCSVESAEHIVECAKLVKRCGAHALRGGAYKPRTSPYSFQGHGEEGLKMLAAARAETGLPIVTEVMDPRNVELVAEYADVMQIGARNMQNFTLLKEVGQAKRPVLLKRGMSATVEDLLLAAEYILSEGNTKVILCERGIRTFEKAYRNTADLSAIPTVQELSHLPIIFDPSHALGRRRHIATLSCAGIAAGCDGLIIEVHPDPEHAASDGPQCLNEPEFSECIGRIRPYVELAGKVMR
ncbi:MAG: 3-deoxy-7-phosphoheptulonate synthase [Candidatus Hydrogenedentota bacterium]|nr:MAG: 3-deoxy-7-phosphoheptulonate synthase [Candidatus Hydrogenedentota bacterium]